MTEAGTCWKGPAEAGRRRGRAGVRRLVRAWRVSCQLRRSGNIYGWATEIELQGVVTQGVLV